ncbi:MAG: AMP-binding protein [Streptosporangiaceae bacterium]
MTDGTTLPGPLIPARVAPTLPATRRADQEAGPGPRTRRLPQRPVSAGAGLEALTLSRPGPDAGLGLWGIAGATPDRTAVIEPDGRAVSYAVLAALADRYGRGLQALGLRPGDTVGGQLPTS